jgi:hypothetical protein
VCLAVLIAACGSASDPDAPRPPAEAAATTAIRASAPDPWAHEAVLFLDAFLQSEMSGRRTARVQLYARDAVVEDPIRGLLLDGRDAIVTYPASLLDSPPMTVSHFLGAERAAMVIEVPADTGQPIVDMLVLAMRAEGIERVTHELTAQELHSYGFLALEEAEQLGTRYEAYVAAWDVGEGSQVEGLYRAGTVRRDGLFGGSSVVGGGSGDLPRHLAIGSDGFGVEPVVVPHHPGDPDLVPAVFTVPARGEPNQVHALVDVVTMDGCRLRMLAIWDLEGGVIAGEEVMYGVAGMRECGSSFGLADPPEGWWTGRSLPGAVADEVTGLVESSTGTIELLNAGPRQAALVEWALGRFDHARVVTPTIDEVAFPPTAWCARGTGDFAGVAVFEGSRVRVELCLLEGAVCTGPTCDTYRADARFGLLHELAHVWERQQLDDGVRADFMEQWGIEVWAREHPPWAPSEGPEGVEVAADVIAWGLMDADLSMVRIPHATHQDLTEGFFLLTGTAPVSRTPASPTCQWMPDWFLPTS